RPGRPATHHRSRTRVRHRGRRGHGVVADPARATDRAGPHGCRRRTDGLYRDDLPHRAVSGRPPRAAALARASDRRLGGQPRRAVYRAAGGRRSTALGRTPFTTSYLVFIALMVIGAISVSLSPETVDLAQPTSTSAPKFVLRHAQTAVFVGAAAVAFCSFAI